MSSASYQSLERKQSLLQICPLQISLAVSSLAGHTGKGNLENEVQLSQVDV